MKPKLLFLFPDGWDEAALGSEPAIGERFHVVREGFDLFRFPQNANLLWFDARRWVGRLARRYRNAGVAGVVSTNEQYGALLAATLARELDLPGTDPAAIIRAQHKYYARCALAHALPEANPRVALLPYAFEDASIASRDPGLPFPFFVKPVKATYSVLAKRVEHREFRVDPLQMMGESLLEGVQINVDGWMHRGAIGFFGIVDSVMYPGTQAFARFEYPSRLPVDAQSGAYATAERAMRAVGFDHGAFNIELFWQPATGRMHIVEINPRLAAQFGDLYDKVDGTHPYAVLADLASGRAPRWVRGQGRFRAATSFVLREFDGAVKVAPDRMQLRWLAEHHPDARLFTFIKHGGSRAREMKWLGSYRYAAMNVGGASREDVEQRFADICRHVTFERASPALTGAAILLNRG